MKKIVSLFTVCIIAMMTYAVPAKRGWQTRTQADGTTIEVQQVGDEFYHFMINREGKQVREINGMYEVVGEAPTPAVAKARRAKGVARRQRKEFGVTPNFAEKGLVILVNFANSTMKTTNNQAKFDNLLNAENCTANSGYPSAATYFSDQSNGTFNPKFDVYGPVTLSNNVSYYGSNNDEYAADAVIEACIALNTSIDFSQYDNDGDGNVDVVFVIYAGKGEADGGASSTIWPHNYSIQDVLYWSSRGQMSSNYTKSQTKLDGVYLDNYVVAPELDGSGALEGIGTICHEFGHALGLPDFYDTNANEEETVNSSNYLTPNMWDVMDAGSYNKDGHCPPNYSPWEKSFFGWITPENLGNEGRVITGMKANGVEGYQVYQINQSGNQQKYNESGVCYYLENRQQQGWDAGVPGHGLLIWKVNYSATAWTNNEPNNTANNPLYTIVSASGTQIGNSSNGPKNTYPGTAKITSKTLITGKPLLNITESNQQISFTYIEEPAPVVDPFDVQWFSNGTLFETNKCTEQGKVVLPSAEPEACANGRVFIGWCADASYASETTAPTLVKAGDAVEEGAAFYAVFAKQSGEGGAEETSTYTFTSKAWADGTNSWTSTKDANQLTTGLGVQVTTGVTGAGAESKAAFDKVSKVVVTYCTNASKGAGSVEVAVGSTKVSHDVTKTGGNTLRTLDFDFDKVSGKAAFTVTCTTNSIYVNSIAITSGGGASYSNYSTSCAGETAIEDVEAAKPAAFKTIREGRIVIIRGDEEFTITGERIR